MEVFDFDHQNLILADKSTINGLRQNIKKLFRVVEISLVLISLTWASSRLPFAVKLSGDFFRRFLNVVAGHLFIFLLSNVLVLTLFLKSRHHQNANGIDFCQELIDNIGGGTHLAGKSPTPPPAAAEVVYQDKQTILEVMTEKAEDKVHRRSSSEITERKGSLEEDCDGVQRSETAEKLRRGAAEEEAEMVVDGLSNEEFQKTIEAFIAKQVEFHQQEKVAIVVHG